MRDLISIVVVVVVVIVVVDFALEERREKSFLWRRCLLSELCQVEGRKCEMLNAKCEIPPL